ncbi:MAG: L-threonylcarbamoyladenylate synthase [Patescibacteria group bacterium]|nr:L-threonylcarbamoyladenylate synthase [Patescibacteria group bacterium]
MKIVKSESINWQKINNILKNDGVIVYPTDTAYGLAADFFSEKALKKVYRIKQRPLSKKIALIASSLAPVKKYFCLNKKELSLAKKYWPGPLTLILKLKNKEKKVGVRVPDFKMARELAKNFEKPITATSANLSGQPNPYSASQVVRQFKNKKNQPDLIIDAGRLKKIKPSTVAEIINDKIKIIRKGPINL